MYVLGLMNIPIDLSDSIVRCWIVVGLIVIVTVSVGLRPKIPYKLLRNSLDTLRIVDPLGLSFFSVYHKLTHLLKIG